MYLIRDLYPEYMKNSYYSIIKITITQFLKKQAKELNRRFFKEDIQQLIST